MVILMWGLTRGSEVPLTGRQDLSFATLVNGRRAYTVGAE